MVSNKTLSGLLKNRLTNGAIPFDGRRTNLGVLNNKSMHCNITSIKYSNSLATIYSEVRGVDNIEVKREVLIISRFKEGC